MTIDGSGQMMQEMSRQLAEVTESRDRAFREIAAAWRSLSQIPGYPHVRTAADPETGAASLAVNIDQLAAELAEAKAS
jgi:hypothetical protein